MGQFVTNITYTPAADIAVLILCIAMLLTIGESIHYRKYNSFDIFKTAVVALIIAVAARLMFEKLYHTYFDSVPIFVYYALNDINKIAYYCQLSIYIAYMYSLLNIKGRNIVKLFNVSGILLGTISTILEPITGLGMYIAEDYTIYKHVASVDTFTIIHIYYIILIMNILVYNRKNIMNRLYNILITILALDIIILSVSNIKNTESFISITFLIPLVAVMFNVHSNPFDIISGSYNYSTLLEKVDLYKKKDIPFTLVCITFINLSDETMRDMQSKLFNFYDGYIERGKLYKLNNNRFILAFKDINNTNIDESVSSIADIIKMIANSYKADYKITVFKKADGMKSSAEYLDIIDYFERREDIDTIHWITDEDTESFRDNKIIVNEIQHIPQELMLDTDIIKAYCQPIYNVEKKQFATAEALMRMEIPELGMIYPDRFIKVAEESGIIHKLSMIILNKVCKEIKQLLIEGYDIDRISVNFSVMELREKTFVEDIKRIIDNNGIPYSKIGIELTETKTDKDFELIQTKVGKLKELGMCIYLDDFGTGYSNIERIMKLPLDTIKFDRSMLLLSHENEEYKYIVANTAKMFSKLNYTILFEGVETDNDEEICKLMQAEYLQGFKYSKPVPIERIREFLTKK